ncbi:MAG TPA: pilus assembly protein TadG-related protein [Tepidisphaeraceae bacterium]|nr:pilus assembly protein TadG-related protein [Tepidisphaeraceae bacterium]
MFRSGTSAVGAISASRRGLVLIYVMLSMIIFLVVASLAIDMGHARLAKTQLQFAADAAARAAAEDLPKGQSTAQQTAVTIGADNNVDGTPLVITPSSDVVFGTWDPNARTFTPQASASSGTSNAIRINASRTAAKGNAIQLAFASAFSSGKSDIHATATACFAGGNGAYSIVGMNSISMTMNSYTDSYNSSVGPYNSASPNHRGSIASNGNIGLSGSVKVDGDSRAGVGKTTTVGGTATVTGLNAPLGTVMSYPSASLPSSYTDLGDVNISSGTTTIPGGTYLIHNLTLSGTAHIIWTGPTVLYIQNSYTVTNTVQIDTYQNIPSNRVLNFLPTCTTAIWNGTNICTGDLYAPDTDFTIGGTVQMFGRILAKSITHSGGGGMHYDEALGAPGGGATGSSVTLVQ